MTAQWHEDERWTPTTRPCHCGATQPAAPQAKGSAHQSIYEASRAK